MTVSPPGYGGIAFRLREPEARGESTHIELIINSNRSRLVAWAEVPRADSVCPSTAGSDSSGTIRGSGAVTYDVCGNDDRDSSAADRAADHFDIAARNNGVTHDSSGNDDCGSDAANRSADKVAAGNDGATDTTTRNDNRDAVKASGRASDDTACPGRSRAIGSTEPGRTNSPERSEDIGTSNSFGSGTGGSDGSSNQPPPGSGGTSSRIASHNASGSRHVGGRPPADPDGAGSARV